MNFHRRLGKKKAPYQPNLITVRSLRPPPFLKPITRNVMACSNRAVRLRDSISNWDQDFKRIKEPNAAFQEELTILRDRSRKRLEQFALDPSQDDISLVQLALLSDGRQIKELELNHAATRAQKQEAYDHGTEVLVGKIIGDLVNIFGLPTMQRLATELFSPIGDQGHIARPSGHFNELSPPDQPDATAEELVLQPNGYHTRRAGRLRPMILPSPHSSVAKSGVVGILRSISGIM